MSLIDHGNNMTDYFKLLPELPRVPSFILDKIDITERPKRSVLKLDADMANWQDDYEWILPTTHNINGRKKFDDESIEWFANNVSPNFNKANAGWQFTERTFPIHCDVTRDYVLLYVIERGGDNADLAFYEDPGLGLRNARGVEFPDVSNLTELMRIPGPPLHTWYMIDTQVLHGVENQSSPRITLQLSFDIGSKPILHKG
jgi:hypothetical protein